MNSFAAKPILYVGIELSKNKWVCAFSVDFGGSIKTVALEEPTSEALRKKSKEMVKKFELKEDAPIVSCYEAGRHAFSIHRQLIKLGIENHVVGSSSIEMKRKKRNPKTDRIDARKLVSLLYRKKNGEKDCCKFVNVPSVDDEDFRIIPRGIECVKKEATKLKNRMNGILATKDISLKINKSFLKSLEKAKVENPDVIGGHTENELKYCYERLQLAWKHCAELDKKMKTLQKEKPDLKPIKRIRQLQQIKGIDKSAALLVAEFFGWREFKNRRQVAALAGLCGTPYSSGSAERDQGISKDGNKRVRSLMVELSWLWKRYQPNSKLTRWFNDRFAGGGTRQRRKGIVAVARKLLIALWKYLEFGEIPEGAVLNAQ